MSRKVLVVDDEKLIVKGIRFNLEQDGMEVDCAYDGEEAVEKAKENKYDIILLDLLLQFNNSCPDLTTGHCNQHGTLNLRYICTFYGNCDLKCLTVFVIFCAFTAFETLDHSGRHQSFFFVYVVSIFYNAEVSVHQKNPSSVHIRQDFQFAVYIFGARIIEIIFFYELIAEDHTLGPYRTCTNFKGFFFIVAGHQLCYDHSGKNSQNYQYDHNTKA